MIILDVAFVSFWVLGNITVNIKAIILRLVK